MSTQHQVTAPGNGAAAPRRSGGKMAVLLGVGAVLYTLLAAGCAVFLLWKAYSLPAGFTPDEFTKLAVAALIAVVGTGLTGLAAVDGATVQSATAYQVAQYNGDISAKLAEMKETADANLADMKKTADTELTLMKGKLDESLTKLKAASDESLTRLKVALDAGQNANRELFGTATRYFHALRSVGLGKWDEVGLKAADTSMISATPQLLHVDEEMRNLWFDFWQRSQQIHRTADKEPDMEKRPALVSDLILQKVTTASGRMDLRELHDRLEGRARLAIKAC
jgi:hypothetical protein